MEPPPLTTISYRLVGRLALSFIWPQSLHSNVFESKNGNMSNEGDNKIMSQNDSETAKDTVPGTISSLNADSEAVVKNVATEDSSNYPKGDTEVQKPMYKPAKPYDHFVP